MKHKHRDLIVRWAADTSRPLEYSATSGIWNRVVGKPAWDESVEYRFADDVIQYRVALLKGSLTNSAVIAHSLTDAINLESDRNFSRWLTDWIEAPVKKPAKAMQRWVNLYNYGAGGLYLTEREANQMAGGNRIECRLIEWDVPE